MTDTVENLVYFLVAVKAVELFVVPLYVFTRHKMMFKDLDEIKNKLNSLVNSEKVEVVQQSSTTDQIIQIKELLETVNANQMEMTNNQNQLMKTEPSEHLVDIPLEENEENDDDEHTDTDNENTVSTIV